MEKFIKENWFKISIVAVMLLICLSVSCYLVIFIPKKEAAALETQKQQTAIQKQQLELQQAQADEQQKEHQEEQQVLEQQAAAAKQAADQQATEQQAAAGKTAYNKLQLDSCLKSADEAWSQESETGMNMAVFRVKTGISLPFPSAQQLEQEHEDAVNRCYHLYPQN